MFVSSSCLSARAPPMLGGLGGSAAADPESHPNIEGGRAGKGRAEVSGRPDCSEIAGSLNLFAG